MSSERSGYSGYYQTMTTSGVRGLLEREDVDLDMLKGAIRGLLDIIDEQSRTISHLKSGQVKNDNKLVELDNAVDDIKDRVLEVERYSRKSCLIFNSIDLGEDPINNVLDLMNDFLRMDIQASDIAACHQLGDGDICPVIVKFIYSRQRDLAWRRKSWLKGAKNSKGYSIYLEECLTPTDREIKKEARSNNIKVFTRRQQVYATNPHYPHSDAVLIKSVDELQPFKTDDSVFEVQTPLPPLIPKPSLISNANKRIQNERPPKRSYPATSPVQLSNIEKTARGFANTITQMLVPALLEAMQPAKLPNLNDTPEHAHCSTEPGNAKKTI